MDLRQFRETVVAGDDDGRSQVDISTRQLRVFVAVYEERSVTDAADMLLLSQPSVSRIIKSLESRLETTLFERTRRGLVPTPDAERLLKPAIAALGEVDRAVDQIRAGGESTGLHIGAGSCLLMFVAPAARAFAEETGSLGSVQFADAAGIIEQLNTRGLDLGFLAALDGQIPQELFHQRVGAIEHAVFGPPGDVSAGLALPPVGSWERAIFDATSDTGNLPPAVTTAPGAATKRLLREGYTVHLPVICGKDVPDVAMIGDAHVIGVHAISPVPIEPDSPARRFAEHVARYLE